MDGHEATRRWLIAAGIAWEVAVIATDLAMESHHVTLILLTVPVLALSPYVSRATTVVGSFVAFLVALVLSIHDRTVNTERQWTSLVVVVLVCSFAVWIATLTRRLGNQVVAASEEANHDSLTGLRNRRGISTGTLDGLEGGRPLAVILVDLDHFKQVNDTYGHDVGDQVLIEVAHRLRGAVRDQDVVSRYGGEEFVVLSRSGDDAPTIAERILHDLRSQPVDTPSVALTVTASAGVASVDDEGGVEFALLRADEALYAAKRAGRDQVVVWSASASQRWNAPRDEHVRRAPRDGLTSPAPTPLIGSGALLEHVHYLIGTGSMAWIDTDVSGRIVGASTSVDTILGVTPDEIEGTMSWDLFDERDRTVARSRRQAILRGEVVGERPLRVQHATRGSRWVIVGATRRMGAGEVVGAVMSLREFHAETVQRHALAALLEAGKLFATAESESTLVQQLCDALVNHGEYVFAWYGRRREDFTVEKVAMSREHREYLNSVSLRYDDSAVGRGPTGRALATELLQTIDDLQSEASFLPWQQAALLHGFRSSIAIPVFASSQLDGVITIYAGESEAFPRVAQETLTQIAILVGSSLERIRTRQRMAESSSQEAILSRAIEQTSDSVLITDVHGQIIFVNDALLENSGFERDEVIGHNPRIFQSGLTPPDVYTQMWDRLLRRETWRGQVVNRRKDGRLIFEQTTISPLVEGDRIVGYVGVRKDMTGLFALEERLGDVVNERQALTLAFSEPLAATDFAEAARDFCVRLLSLPAVKSARIAVLGTSHSLLPEVVDFHGVLHLGGEPIELEPDLVARLESGPLLLVSATAEHIGERVLAPSLLTALGEETYKRAALVALSWGAAPSALVVMGVSNDADLVQMDDIMFREIGLIATQSLAELALRYADTYAGRQQMAELIADKSFDTRFQPIVDFRSGTTLGFEALTRFQDGRTPDQVFDESGRLGYRGELERACAQSALDQAALLPADAFVTLNFLPSVLGETATRHLINESARPVIVEVTEYAAVDDYSHLLDAIATLPNARLAVDDAGAGHSSLRHVMELNPDIVKIDISLISNIDARPDKQALVASLVHFGSLTGTILVFEGVERAEEFETLSDLAREWPEAILWGQGYWWSRPAPVSRFR